MSRVPQALYTKKTKGWIKYWLGRLVLARPEASLRLAGSAGRRLASCPGLTTAPSAREVADLLGRLPDSSLVGIRRKIGALERQNQALLFLAQNRGVEPLLPFVRITGEERLLSLRQQGVPAILVDWHVGVPLAHIVGLIKLGVPAMVIGIKSPFASTHPLPESMRFIVGASPNENVSFLVQALDHLRKSGVAIIAVNGRIGDAILEVPFLERRVHVRRGAGALARLSGARFLPVTAEWANRGSRIDLTIHEPLPQPLVSKKSRNTYEDALLTGAARWFEDYVRSHPEQLRLRWFRDYLAAEPYSAPPETQPSVP